MKNFKVASPVIIKAVITASLLSSSALSAFTTEDDKAIAELAAKMEGGSNAKGLHWRLQIKAPLEMPAGGEWFADAGLGLFMHWGPASAHYGSPWVMRRAKEKDSMEPMVVAKDYYQTSLSKFTAENYEPELWMKAAKKAGFRYTVLTAKHHDGYALWPSKYTDLGVKTSLNGKDLLQPYVDAVRNNDMKVGFYFSGVDWHLDKNHMNYMWDNDSGKAVNWLGNLVDADSIKPLPNSIIEQKNNMVYEVMDKYRPDLWWWDSGLPVSFEQTAQKYNPDMLFNNRGNFHHNGKLVGHYPGAHYVTPENFHMVNWPNMKELKRLGIKWEVCMNYNQGKGWFYESRTGDSEKVRSLSDIMFALARVRSWGGNMLLNIKPKPDGTLPKANYDTFDKMARWMKWGEVSMFKVKGTHFPEHSNVPVTTSKNGKTWWLHARPGESQWQKGAFYEGTQPGQAIHVKNVPALASVKLLRTGESLNYEYEDGNLILPNPDAGPDGLHEIIEITFKH